MNIDIVNKQVSTKLNINEKKVQQINKFYWDRIKEHVYSYNPEPINIEYVCVLYPNKTLIKKAILYYIERIRHIHKSKKFLPNSVRKQEYIKAYSNYLYKFWCVRKIKKYTN